MDQSFGKTLLHFSFACDLVDEGTFEKIRDLILDYTKRVLEIEFDRFLIEGNSLNKKKVLLPHRLATSGNYQVIDVEDENGKIVSLAGYAYLQNVPLWVVSAEGEADLRKATNYRDLWSNEKRLPKYWYPETGFEGDPIRTSILIPVGPAGKIIGVQTYETHHRLDVTKGAKEELLAISTAMFHIYQAHLDYKRRMKDTIQAFNHLNDILQKPLPKLTKPKIFLASSHEADEEVIAVIKNVIEQDYRDKFDLVYWKDMNQPGNINAQLLMELSQCRFGICYFSEKLPEGNGNFLYQDNANVIFEAGMLHGRSANNTQFPATWIPIREQHSTTVPFDFSSERTIMVGRSKGKVGKVLKGELKKALRERVETLAEMEV